MIILTRERLGIHPDSMSAVNLLLQDIDDLDTKRQSKAYQIAELLPISFAIEAEAKRLRLPVVDIINILLQRGQIFLVYKQYKKALSTFEDANEQMGFVQHEDLKVKIYAGLAETLYYLRQWNRVFDICKEGISIVEKFRYQVNAQYLQSTYLRSRIGLYKYGIRAAYELENFEAMLEWLELSKCRSVLRHNNQAVIKNAELEKTENDFREVCRQIDDSRTYENKTQLNNLLNKRRLIWDKLTIQRSQSRSDNVIQKFDLLAIQKLLDSDEAILYYYWLDLYTLLIVVIDDRRCKANLYSLTMEEQKKLRTYAEVVIESLSTDLEGYAEYIDNIKHFGTFLLPDEIVNLIKSKSRLLISPHQVLHATPFQALPWDDENSYLIQRFAITYIPNISSLLPSYKRSSTQSLFAMGVSDFSQHPSESEPLKEVQQEIDEIKTLYLNYGYKVETLLNEEANEATLRQLENTNHLAKFNCLHISTHGQNVNSDTPMESYMLLYDSILDGLEIANWHLNAELIVLSACSSGQRPFQGRGMTELPGDDMFGLQASFFAAGAKQILAPLWPVNPTIARSIILAFYSFLLDKNRPEIALQKAIVQHIDNAKIRSRKSYYWAPFFLTSIQRPSLNDNKYPF